MANHDWNYWTFQIHWNKLEWVNPRSHIEQNKTFFVSSKNIYLEDNNKNAHWVGNSKLKTLDIEDFF